MTKTSDASRGGFFEKRRKVMQESITSNLNKLAVARTAWNCAQRVYIYIARASFALADVDFYEIVADESSLLEPLTPAICVLSCIQDARRDVSRWLMVVFHRLRSTACRLHLSRRNREKKHHVFPSEFWTDGIVNEMNSSFFFLFFFKCDRRYLDSSFEFWVNYSWTRIDFISDFRY